MNIAISGTGYVGLVSGVCFASHGHSVTCVDNDQNKLEILQSGRSPIYEPGLELLMSQYAHNLFYTNDYKFAYSDADIIFICVGTPEKADGSANLQYIYDVAGQIAKCISKDTIVVIKSTVPIGTNDKIERYIQQNIISNNKVYVVSNPEFMAQGTAVNDTLNASRIVIGVEDAITKIAMEELYKDFNAPLVITNRRSSEMIKYACNDFLALKISYINEIANLCELVGADIEDVSKGMGYDARIGSKFLKAGIGYGGSCFPKDTKALHWLANYHDYEIKTIKAAIEINENQKLKLLKKARKYYDDFSGIIVSILGLTFKPQTDDLREAPSLANIPILLEENAIVKAYDPIGMKNFKNKYPDKIYYCDSIEETLENSDVCFIFTEWDDIVNVDLNKFTELMNSPIVLDGRNCYKLKDVLGRGFIYESIGRKTIMG